MSSIKITSMGPNEFGVEIDEGHLTTGHRVRVPDDLFDAGLPIADPELLVRESIGFLLEREPATAIRDDFSIAEIADFFPEYIEEITTRVSTAP